METGSKLIAALMAVIVIQLLEPSRPPSPYWHLLLAALIGTTIAWGMARVSARLRKRLL